MMACRRRGVHNGGESATGTVVMVSDLWRFWVPCVYCSSPCSVPRLSRLSCESRPLFFGLVLSAFDIVCLVAFMGYCTGIPVRSTSWKLLRPVFFIDTVSSFCNPLFAFQSGLKAGSNVIWRIALRAGHVEEGMAATFPREASF